MQTRGVSAAPQDRWASRPALAFLLRGLAYTAPILASVITVSIGSRTVPRPATTGPDVLWWTGLLLVGTVALVLTDRVARRLLPLAALLRLSLVFPDAAPPRFSVALRNGTVRSMRRHSSGLTAAQTPSEIATTELAAMIGMLHQHDRMTRGHAERVRAYSQLIAQELGISGEERDKLQWAALLHDIGKLEVPTEILNKPAQLNDEEYAVIRSHPGAGGVLIDPLRWWLGDWAGAVGEHHERFDGQGYPRGLAGMEITLAGRIVAVADAFDVMTAARAYKKPQDPAAARAELTRCAGSHFDPVVVRAFLSMSLGRLRRTMGPLSWLANLPVLGSVASVPLAGTTIGAVAATAIGAGVVTLAPLQSQQIVEPRFDATVALGEPASLSRDRVPEQAPSDNGTSVVTLPTTTSRPDNPAVAVTTATVPPPSQPPTSPPPIPTATSHDVPSTTAPSTTTTTAPPPTVAPTTTVATTTTTTTTSTTAPTAPPQAVADTATVPRNGFVNIRVLRNDIDPAGLGLTVIGVTASTAGGATTNNGNGTVRFEPKTGFSGPDTFTYTVQDGLGRTATATVTVTVS